LHYFIRYAASSNTKLLLVRTSDESRDPTHGLVAVLADNLPWAKAVGAPADNHLQRHRNCTAMDRVREYLATNTGGRRKDREAATQLLARRDRLIDSWREAREADRRWAADAIII